MWFRGNKCLVEYEAGSPVWIMVEPIDWIIFRSKNNRKYLLSKNILFAGIPFDTKETYDGDFENTFIKKFMDEYFSKDIQKEGSFRIIEENSLTKKLK